MKAIVETLVSPAHRAVDYYRFPNGKLMGWRLDHWWEFFDLTTGEDIDGPLEMLGAGIQPIECGQDATDVRFVTRRDYWLGPLPMGIEGFVVNIFSLDGEYRRYQQLERDRPAYATSFASSAFLSFNPRRYARSVHQVMYGGSVEHHYERVDACEL